MAAAPEVAGATAHRSVAIDLLRGVAVAMVMIAHLPFSRASLGSAGSTDVYPPPWFTTPSQQGHYGVQLFLVISGYCIHTRWARKADLTTRVAFFPFWRRRLTRLYPPYLVALAGSAGLTIVAQRLFPGAVAAVSTTQLVIDLVLLLLLVQNVSDASGRIGNPPFWSLALEEQLYLLYFPLLAVRRKRGWPAALALSLFVTIAWVALGSFVPPSWQFAWGRVGPAYWFAWALGALAAEAHLDVVRLPAWMHSWLLFPLTCLAGALVHRSLRDLTVTISFFFLIRATTEAERKYGAFMARGLGPLVALGSISYGVYLVHNLAFIVSKRVLVSLGLPDFATLVLRFVSGLVVGWILYRLVERPFLRISSRIPIPMVHDRTAR